MSGFATDLVRALRAERMKLRGTLAAWMCLIAPGVVVALLVLQLTLREMKVDPTVDGAQAWTMFSRSVLGLWTFLMLPLFVTLQSALLAGLEHGNAQWKHLHALPVPRAVHYLAKVGMLAAMLFAATAVIAVLILPGGWLVGRLQPGFPVGGPPPWLDIARGAGATAACALLIVAIHAFVAIRWRSFTVAVATGMVATVAGFLIGQSERFGPWYPWSLPLQVFAGDGRHLPQALALSLAGTVVVTALGVVLWTRRDTV